MEKEKKKKKRTYLNFDPHDDGWGWDGPQKKANACASSHELCTLDKAACTVKFIFIFKIIRYLQRKRFNSNYFLNIQFNLLNLRNQSNRLEY